MCIALDVSGNAYTTGNFYGNTCTFGPVTLINTGTNNEIYIARLDAVIATGINDVPFSQNMTSIFPNPFSTFITFSFSLSQSENVSLKIFDVNGRLVSTLADKIFDAGENELVWYAGEVNAGVYFLRFQSAKKLQTEKLIVTK